MQVTDIPCASAQDGLQWQEKVRLQTMSGTQRDEREPRVGVRQFRDHMREFLDRVAAGDEVVLTDRGVPVARVVAYDSKFQDLVDRGVIRLAEARSIGPERRRIKATGSVSDLIERNR